MNITSNKGIYLESLKQKRKKKKSKSHSDCSLVSNNSNNDKEDSVHLEEEPTLALSEPLPHILFSTQI